MFGAGACGEARGSRADGQAAADFSYSRFDFSAFHVRGIKYFNGCREGALKHKLTMSQKMKTIQRSPLKPPSKSTRTPVK